MIDVMVGDIIIPKRHKQSHFLSGWEQSYSYIIVTSIDVRSVYYTYKDKSRRHGFLSSIPIDIFDIYATICPVNRKKILFKQEIDKL